MVIRFDAHISLDHVAERHGRMSLETKRKPDQLAHSTGNCVRRRGDNPRVPAKEGMLSGRHKGLESACEPSGHDRCRMQLHCCYIRVCAAAMSGQCALCAA